MEARGSTPAQAMKSLFRRSMSLAKTGVEGKKDAMDDGDVSVASLPPLDLKKLSKDGSRSFAKKLKESLKKGFTPRGSLRKSLSGSFRGGIPSVESSAPSTVSVMSESPLSSRTESSPSALMPLKEHARVDKIVDVLAVGNPRDSASDFQRDVTPMDSPKLKQVELIAPLMIDPPTVTIGDEVPARTEPVVLEENLPAPAAEVEVNMSAAEVEADEQLSPLKMIDEEAADDAAETAASLLAEEDAELGMPQTLLAQTPIAASPEVEQAIADLPKPILAVEGSAALSHIGRVEVALPKELNAPKRVQRVRRIAFAAVAVVAAAAVGVRVVVEKQQKNKA